MINIETTNICNLSCSFCPHFKMKRGQGVMSLKDFKRTINLFNSDIVGLTNFGEPFMDKNIFDKINYVKKSYTYLTTNGTFLTKNIVSQILKSNLSELRVSVYSDDVKEKVENLLRIKTDALKVSVCATEYSSYWDRLGVLRYREPHN